MAKKTNRKNPKGKTHGTVSHLRRIDAKLRALAKRIADLENRGTERQTPNDAI